MHLELRLLKNNYRSIQVLLLLIIFTIQVFCSNEKFNLGIQDYPETNVVINNSSINDIIIELFEKKLKLDLNIVKGTWRESYRRLENGEVAALGLVSINNKKNKNIVLSNPIYNENLYVASNKKILKTSESLENENIYVYKGDNLPIQKLKSFLNENNISANIIEVENIDDYTSEIYLDSEFISAKFQNRLLVSYLAPICIGINKKYEYLLPEINKALDEGYRVQITQYINNLPKYYQRERFLKLLTENEKNWLLNKKVFRTAFETDSTLSLYLKSENKYIGILPAYIDKLSEIINIPIEYKTHKDNNRSNSLIDLENGEIDFLIDSENVENKFILSAELYKLPVYLMSHLGSMSSKIGIVKTDLSLSIAEKFFMKENIVYYLSPKELSEGWKSDEVGAIISASLSSDETCKKLHKSVMIEKVPLKLLILKERMVLKSILDKAISVIADVDRREIDALVKERQEENLLLEKEKNQKKQLYFIAFSIVILLLLFKLRKEKVLNKKLKYDQLTKLPNRYLFNQICKKKYLGRGVAIVIDLDNFKFVNDIYGHSVGDSVLIEVSNILLKIFKKESCFRISGDEFYIFYEEEDEIVPKIEDLFRLGKSSILLKNYEVSFSLGAYEKEIHEKLSLAFDKADFKMYEAKKIKGFSYCI
ncbi:transporter substrate-binding domain-containing diguanylate cyclase [Cetobacterium sp.]|uniref:transporter substrate-binding domain-containing diguanylate cyclase n=1 Tax=Cetobacterium sp. TaxID=2071632 RepID=UPI003F674ABB